MDETGGLTATEFEKLHATSLHQMSQRRHAPNSHCFVYCVNLLLHSEAHHDCSTEHHNIHWSVLSSLSGAAEFSTVILQRKCLDNKMMYLHFSNCHTSAL